MVLIDLFAQFLDLGYLNLLEMVLQRKDKFVASDPFIGRGSLVKTVGGSFDRWIGALGVDQMFCE